MGHMGLGWMLYTTGVHIIFLERIRLHTETVHVKVLKYSHFDSTPSGHRWITALN